MEVLLAAGGLVLALVLAGVVRHRLGVGDQHINEHHPNTMVDREVARSQVHVGNDINDFSG